jgi:hypothetical protein
MYPLLILSATALGSVVAVELMLLALRCLLTAFGVSQALLTNHCPKGESR